MPTNRGGFQATKWTGSLPWCHPPLSCSLSLPRFRSVSDGTGTTLAEYQGKRGVPTPSVPMLVPQVPVAPIGTGAPLLPRKDAVALVPTFLPMWHRGTNAGA